MAAPKRSDAGPIALPDRLASYLEKIEQLVREGVEHPRYEFKRELLLQTSEQKAGFAKLVQGIANAHLSEERFLVIGADAKTRTFVSVVNSADFDAARISPIISRYLDPLPLFESFPDRESADGTKYVLVAFAAAQPRPIIVKSDLQGADGKFLLRRGEVWLKENTGLRCALRSDFDSMYEEQAEASARRRFEDFSNQLISSQRVGLQNPKHVPQPNLIYGDTETFRLYVKELIADQQDRLFAMLIELLRDLTVDEWHSMRAYDRIGLPGSSEFLTKVVLHERDTFLPAYRALVEAGLLLIKHEGAAGWISSVVDLLTDVFDSSQALTGLDSLPLAGENTIFTVGRLFPAVEASVAVRTLGTYCLRRGNAGLLSDILKRTVRSLSPPHAALHPFCFWPLPFGLKTPEGLNLFMWEHRIKNYWGQYYGNQEGFLASASQFEFVLEFNSWLGTSPQGRKWIEKFRPRLSMGYWPDIVHLDFSEAVTIAERLYEALRRGKDADLLVFLMVDKSLLDVPVELVANDLPLLLFAFLDYFGIARARAYSSAGYFAPRLDWGPKLQPLLEDYRKKKEVGTLPPNLSYVPEVF